MMAANWGKAVRFAATCACLFVAQQAIVASGQSVPENDNFAAAIDLGHAIAGQALGDTTLATYEFPEVCGPAFPCPRGPGDPLILYHTVWYRWRPLETIDVNFLCAGLYMQVFEGTTIENIRLVVPACDNAASLCRFLVPFHAEPEREYFIQIGGPFEDGGLFALTWTFAGSGGGNDQFADAIALEGESGSVESTNENATREPDEPDVFSDRPAHTLWYRWTPPSTQKFTFHTLGSDFDTTLAVYSGTSLTTLTPVVWDDDGLQFRGASVVTFQGVASQEYRIAVAGFGSEQGAVTLSWVPAPPNDHFSAAEQITDAAGSITRSNIGATTEPCPNPPDDCGEPFPGNGGRSLWYRWVAPEDGRWRFDLCGTSLISGRVGEPRQSYFQANLAAYLGGITPDKAVASVLHSYGGEGTAISFSAQRGLEYRIWVSFPGYGDGGGSGDQGDVALNWTPVPNDSVEVAQPIPAAGTITATIGGAGPLWFRWQAPADERTTFSAAGSPVALQITVYTGSSEQTLTEVARNTEINGTILANTVTFDAVHEETYNIAVLGAQVPLPGSSAPRPCYAAGDIALSWGPVPSPTPSATDTPIDTPTQSVSKNRAAPARRPSWLQATSR